MTVCRLCKTDLNEGNQCDDTKACARRARANARRAVATMTKLPLTTQRQKQLYDEQMRKQR